ncbi:MAG: hypothetical protein GWM98_27310 [Nitrospinaceae bacterium]|nr:hypothetical protein [Nitrospinaceae bacterium]NIR57485.1 hypothetical protein [Nitrospinaceae bacterium]NIS87955.1 hypothetical protein [Nitrospinaceae bacterium]NIT84820.1 hypothetical protein [Nitrospinaceae bacterium]NIU47000.1 hypothetical protein [Nitrospinaceae bacterium]
MVYKGVVKKEKINAVIRTAGEKIEGTIYKLPQNRLLDMLNHGSDTFIPVSGARVFCVNSGQLMYEAEFMAVNKNHVVNIADNTNGAAASATA